jgi:hypothetical protein
VLLLVLVLALVCRRVLLCLQQCRSSSSRLAGGRACRIRLLLQLLRQQCTQKLAGVWRLWIPALQMQQQPQQLCLL